MLEVKYDEATKLVRAWNADPDAVGNLKSGVGEVVVIFPNAFPPKKQSDFYAVDSANQVVVPNPNYKPSPPSSIHQAVVLAIDATSPMPVKVKRVWSGYEYISDCSVVQSVAPAQGKLKVGDIVLVLYDETAPIILDKVFRP